MKRLQVLLVAVVGAAAAIPGMAALGRFDVPGGAEVLFEFVLAVFSAAAVLLLYVCRPRLSKLSLPWIVGGSVAGLIVVFALFILHVSLTNKVLVTHEWRGEPTHQFVPLFLPDSVEAAIARSGSRRAYIQENGPDVFLTSTSESNIAATLAVLLASYTALVACVAAVFAILGFRALSEELQPESSEPSGAAG